MNPTSLSDATRDELVAYFGLYMTHPPPATYLFYLILILFQVFSTALLCCLKHISSTHFHPVNDLFLITGRLHLLRWISLYCCRFAHDYWDRYSRRPLLPICKDSLPKSFNLFSLLMFLSERSSSLVGCISVTDSTFRGLSCVTQQIPWLHMLYAAIGAIIYTLVSLRTLI